MRVLTLDLARRTGFAIGDAGTIPKIGAKRLHWKDSTVDDACAELQRFLRDTFTLEKPDLVVVEDALMPRGQLSVDAVIWAQRLRGAVAGVVGCYRGVELVAVASATFRTHFCGQRSAAPRRPRGAPATPKQREADRAATNNMVHARAVALGYLPKFPVDWDKASAAAMFDWAAAKYGRHVPADLRMFGEGA